MDYSTINIYPIPVSLLLQEFGNHQLAHPINTVITRLHAKMMGFAFCDIEKAFLLGRWHQLEAKYYYITFLFPVAKFKELEC